MSNLSDAIQTLLTLDLDTNLVDDVCKFALDNESVDVSFMYDYHTGAPIGRINSDELQFAIEEEACEDIESLADAMIVRCVASMRPSPAMNKPDRTTIRKLVLSRPRHALAYLLNRLYHPLSLKRSAEESFAALRGRIKMFQLVESFEVSVVHELTHWLLEVDSTFNLSKHADYPVKFPLYSLIANPVKFTESVLKYLVKNDDKFVDGNRLTNHAYLESYFDHPDYQHKKEVMRRPLRDTFTTRKKASGAPKKTSALQAKVNQSFDLLAAAMATTTTVESSPKREALKLKSSVIAGGQLFANRKKES